MKYVLSMLLACLLTAPALANEWRVDATGGVAYQHQVIDLPQDAKKHYCSIIGHPSDPQYRQLCQWFGTNPELRKIREGTHFHEMDTTSILFQSRYDVTTGALPCVRLQDAEGNVIFQCSADRLPLSPEALANSIATTCRRRNVQPITPQPVNPQPNVHYHFTIPDQAPDKQEPDQTQPDVFDNEKESMEVPIWVYVTIGVVAFVIGIGLAWHGEFKQL